MKIRELRDRINQLDSSLDECPVLVGVIRKGGKRAILADVRWVLNGILSTGEDDGIADGVEIACLELGW